MHPLYGKIAGIDVHKRLLYVVIAPGEEDTRRLRARMGATVSELNELADWLAAHQVQTVVMESTALYWRPVWLALEARGFRLLLAHAQSNAAPRGRKRDYADAERLIKRLLADELRLSFVPDAEQRDWRMLTRARVSYGRDRGSLRNHIECVLEEGQIKLSSLLSDLLGVSGWAMLRALANGETDAEKLADMRTGRLKATRAQFCQALAGKLRAPQRLLLGQYLDRIEQIDKQLTAVDKALQLLLVSQQQILARLCTTSGIAADSAEQFLAELGPKAAAFPSADQLTSWVGTCPGRQESAGVSTSNGSPKGNCWVRRLVVQCAWAAVKTKGSYFQSLFRRWFPRLGKQKAIWAVANKLLRIVWRILHLGETYIEHGPIGQNLESLKRRFQRLSKDLAKHGYTSQLSPTPA